MNVNDMTHLILQNCQKPMALYIPLSCKWFVAGLIQQYGIFLHNAALKITSGDIHTSEPFGRLFDIKKLQVLD